MKTTSQKLFSDQSLVELIGPKDTYIVFKREIEAKYDIRDEWINFETLSYDEIYRIRGY